MTEQMTIHELMAQVSREIEAIAKARRTDSGAKYNFRGIDDVLDAIHEPMAKAGIIPSSQVMNLSISERESPGEGGKTRYQTVVVLTKRVIFTGPAGDSTWTEALGEAQDYGDKAVAKAESIAFRTAMIQAFTIPISDPDINIDTETDNSERSGRTAVKPVVEGSDGTKPRTAKPAESARPNLAGLFAIKGRNGESIVPTDDDERHTWASSVLGRPVASFKELTQSDVDVLKKEAKRQALDTPKPDGGYGESTEPF